MIFNFTTQGSAQYINFIDSDSLLLQGQVIKGFDATLFSDKVFEKIQDYNIAIAITGGNKIDISTRHYLHRIAKAMCSWYLENKIESNKSYFKRYLDKP